MSDKSLILPRKNLSTVSFAVGVKYGAVNEDIGGITRVMSNHMLRNTANRSEKDLALHLDKHGIVTFSTVGKGGSWFGMNTPPQNLNIALELMAEILFEPEFKEDTTKKLVQQQKGNISQMDQLPQQRLFQRTRWESAFGDSNISKSTNGTSESMDEINPELIQKNYEEMLKHHHEFIAVGIGIDESNFEGFESKLHQFGSKRFTGELRNKSVPPLNSQVDKMTATTQNSYLGINLQIHGSNTSQYEDELYKNVMAGGFSARFFTEIRDERNLSYACFAINSKLDDFGLITSCLDVRPDRSDEGRDVTLRIMKDVLTEKISEDEMNRAIKSGQQTALFVSDSSQSYANWLISRKLRGLETDLDKVNKAISHARELDWQETMLDFWKKENFTLGIAGEPGNAEETWIEAVEKVL